MRCDGGDGCDLINYSTSKNILRECALSTNETIIHFRYTTMSSIPAEIFTSFLLLKELDASNSHLDSIANMRFEHLPNLVQLDLSNNSIRIIPEEIFIKCMAVEVNLQQNEISELGSMAFHGLSKLMRLDLSYNKIAQLNEGVFNPLINMKELRLDFNRIVVIDDNTFEHNALLQMLYLSNNSIVYIANDAFGSLKHLNSLEIDNNEFPTINLMPMERLRNMYAVNGKLRTLDIPNSVTVLKAYGNQIARINVSIDSNLTSLMVGKNCLTELGDLVEHRKVQNLELSYNNITHLDMSTFVKMRQLRELLLYGIKLNKLDADYVLNHFPNLHIIELSPRLYDRDELNTFLKRLDRRKMLVMREGGKLMNGESKVKDTPASAAPPNTMNKVAVEDVTPVPATHTDSTAEKGRIESTSDRDREIFDRIRRVEQLIQSIDGQRAELQYKQNIDESLHTLRVMIVATVFAISMFVAFHLFVFVRNNYTRLRIQTSTMLSNGRARSHEPMLEEVL